MEARQLDNKSTLLSSVQIQKTDLDIATIQKLGEYAEICGSELVLSGGYAVEALCGGAITRPHGDMDLHMPIVEEQEASQISSEVGNLLSREETKWKLIKQTENKIKFVEDDDEKTDFDKRELELTLHKDKEKPLFTQAFLVNSIGKKVEVLTVDIYELLASKIHALSASQKSISLMGRRTNGNDINDLKRLKNLSSFKKDEVLKILSTRYIKRAGKLNFNEVAQKLKYAETLLK